MLKTSGVKATRLFCVLTNNKIQQRLSSKKQRECKLITVSSPPLRVVGSANVLQKLSFNSFVFESLQEVEQYRLLCLPLLEYKVINLAVSRLTALITSCWGDEAVTAVSRIIEPLMEIAGLSDIEEFTASHE